MQHLQHGRCCQDYMSTSLHLNVGLQESLGYLFAVQLEPDMSGVIWAHLLSFSVRLAGQSDCQEV